MCPVYILHIYIYICHTAIICESYLAVTHATKESEADQVHDIHVWHMRGGYTCAIGVGVRRNTCDQGVRGRSGARAKGLVSVALKLN